MRPERPILATIDHRESGGRAEVEVVLGFRDEAISGVASGPPDADHRPRLVGEATLRAIESILGSDGAFDLSAVAAQDLGPVTVALAQLREGGAADYLVGSAVVRDHDLPTATARAVLDALNRRLAGQA
jgi:hypothetical protein